MSDCANKVSQSVRNIVYALGASLHGMTRFALSLVGALKMREWKMREHIAGVENAGVENAGATKYGKLSEKNTLKHQTKYDCRGFLA